MQHGMDYGSNRRTPRLTLRVFGALLLSVVSAGCYTYVPISSGDVRPSEEVRIRITESAATRIVREFGAYTGQLEGQLTEEGPDSLSVSIAIGREYRGLALENARQTLFLGRTEVMEVRRRQLSRSRTALATASVLAGFAALVSTVVQRGDDNPIDNTPPQPPPGILGASFRIPFR